MRRADLKFYAVVVILVTIIYLVGRGSFYNSSKDFRAIASPKVQLFTSKKPLHCAEDNEKTVKLLSRKYSVSVVVSANPHQDSVISQTVHSIIAYSDPRLLKEVIISNHGKLEDNHFTLLRREFTTYEPLVHLMSSPSDNKLKTKLLVGHAAKGNLVIYLDDTVVVSPGYLLPLIKSLDQHPERIVSPAFNYISATTFAEAEPTGESKWIFDWKFNSVPYELTFQDLTATSETDDLTTSAFDESAFALHKSYLEKLGKVKHGMDYLNSIDLSLSSWMCGEGAYISRCSRIGRIIDGKKHQIDKRTSYKLAIQYLTDKYLSIYNSINSANIELTEAEKQTININAGLRKNMCTKTFKDLVKEVIKADVYIPGDDVIEYGKFFSKTGSTCFEQSAAMVFLGKLHLTFCQGKTIEHLKTGQLRIGNECLMISDKGYIVSDICDYDKADLKWERTSSNQLRTFQSNEYRCISHATDPYPENKNRQVLMYTTCHDESNADHKFQVWDGWTKVNRS